ncbi:unnamed protein product, partial [marine sediment metagenome]
MTHRERVIVSLEHREPDRVPIDLGAMLSTGIMGIAYNRLKAYLGISSGRTRMYDLWQQLAEPEIEILELIGADVLPVFISEPKKWKKSTLPDGSPCEVPDWFNPKFAGYLLDVLVEENIKRLEKILPMVESYVQIIQAGDDLGLQDGPQLSPELYRKIVKPRHKKLYQYVKQHSSAYLFLHTCGSVYEFIPDFIEMGVDILNPVQVLAKNMDTRRLKREFGKDITFWGGGCDTQKVLPFGTQEKVTKEVKRRTEDLAPEGGFVSTQVHNIQVGVPPENIMAMYN